MYDGLGTKREAKISWDKVIDIYFIKSLKIPLSKKWGSLTFKSTNEIAMRSLDDFLNVICRAWYILLSKARSEDNLKADIDESIKLKKNIYSTCIPKSRINF